MMPALALSVAQAALQNLLNPVLFVPRNIAGFVADVTVSEHHIDRSVITEHPVETGAPISDHVYDLPPIVVITAGWSSSSPAALGDPNYIKLVYNQFLALKRSHVPFAIITGKRFYEDMLIEELDVATDENTENVLLMRISCRNVIIVSTQTVTVPDASVMKNEAAHAAPLDRGAVSAKPAGDVSVQ